MSQEYLGLLTPLQAAFSENYSHTESRRVTFGDWQAVAASKYDTRMNYRYKRLMEPVPGAKPTAFYVKTEEISEDEMEALVIESNQRKLAAGNNDRLVRLIDRNFDQLNPVPILGDRFEITRKNIPLFHEDDMRKPAFTERTRAMIEFGKVFWRPMDSSKYITKNLYPEVNPAKWFTKNYDKEAGPLGMFDFFNEKMLRDHLNRRKVYGLRAREDKRVRFGAIDLDLHIKKGGNPDVFLKQVKALLSHLQGQGWYICLSADVIDVSVEVDGIHLIQIYQQERPLAIVRGEIQRILNAVSAKHPELEAEAISKGMKPIREAEIFPDTQRALRLPLGRGYTALIDKPLQLVKYRTVKGVPFWGADVVSFMSWDKTEMSLAAKMKFISERVPSDCVEMKTKQTKARTNQRIRDTKEQNATVRQLNDKKLLGAMKGRYRKVLVEFFKGNMQVPGSLQVGILQGVNALWAQDYPIDDRANFLLGLIQNFAVTDANFSSRVWNQDWDAIRSDIEHIIDSTEAARAEPKTKQMETSNEKLQNWAEAMNRIGFCFGDPETWDQRWDKELSDSHRIHFSEENLTEDDLNIINESFAELLNCSPQVAIDTIIKIIRIVRMKARSGDGIAQEYRRAILIDMGIKCKRNGKLAGVWDELCDAGFIYESQKPIFHQDRRGQGRARGYGIGKRVSDYFRKEMDKLPKVEMPVWLDDCVHLSDSVEDEGVDDLDVRQAPDLEVEFQQWTRHWLGRVKKGGNIR